MSEPTIDEMLDAVERLLIVENREYIRPLLGIRAILVEHRPMERGKGLLLMHPNDIDRGKLEAVRAFVERVEKRVGYEYSHVLEEELAAMEKEQSCQEE